MNAISIPVVVKKSLGWSIALSILMIVAGFLAMALPFAAGIAVNVLVAWLLIFSGGAHLVYAWHTRSVGSSILELLLGILYICVGIFLLLHPLLGLVSLTFAFAVYLFAESGLEFVLAFLLRPVKGWGWVMVDGIVTLVLAMMIWSTWPSNSEWALGLLVGVSMLFNGISRLMLPLAARRLFRELA